jgi:hypothetical protein
MHHSNDQIEGVANGRDIDRFRFGAFDFASSR